MEILTPNEKEIIARAWCSKENSIELISDDVMLLNVDREYFSPFQFDIASRRNRKEYEKIISKQREYEETHEEINESKQQEFRLELTKIMGLDPSKPDEREVLGMVKSGKHDDGGTTYHSILGDCFLLNQAKADKKYMILTDKNMYDYFFNRCKELLDEIILVYLDVYKHKELLV